MGKGKLSTKRVILTSFFVDLIDVVIGLIVAVLTGSVVLLAELFQGISDLLSSGILLIGLKRPKSEILFWSGLSAFCILLISTTLSIYYGWQRIQNPEPVQNILIAFISLTINFITNAYALWLSVLKIGMGKSVAETFRNFRSSGKFLTKNTFVLDLMGMSAALVGLVALGLYQITGEYKYDGFGAVGIGVVLAILAFDLLYMIIKTKKTNL
jgi:divalent metal cation (Fe/Co/Zn/Cd) transporter